MNDDNNDLNKDKLENEGKEENEKDEEENQIEEDDENEDDSSEENEGKEENEKDEDKPMPAYMKKLFRKQERKLKRHIENLKNENFNLQKQLININGENKNIEEFRNETKEEDEEEPIEKKIEKILHKRDVEKNLQYSNEKTKEFVSEIEEKSDDYEDFDEVVRDEKLPLNQYIIGTIEALPIDNRVEFLYNFAKNKKEVNRIAKLHPKDQINEVLKKAFRLSSNASKISNAPEPAKNIVGNMASIS
ncbi:MAG: hypothetical protein ACFFD1_09045, partial [Candidatus Thorarchaeota archaeon]